MVGLIVDININVLRSPTLFEEYVYCVYVGFDYTHVDINTHRYKHTGAGHSPFLAQVWSQAVAGSQKYGAIRSQFPARHNNHIQ